MCTSTAFPPIDFFSYWPSKIENVRICGWSPRKARMVNFFQFCDLQRPHTWQRPDDPLKKVSQRQNKGWFWLFVVSYCLRHVSSQFWSTTDCGHRSKETFPHVSFHQTTRLSSNHKVCAFYFHLCQCRAFLWVLQLPQISILPEHCATKITTGFGDEMVVQCKEKRVRSSDF